MANPIGGDPLPRFALATCLHGIPTQLRDGTPAHDASPEAWAGVFQQIAALGFDHVELSDSHLRLADVDTERGAEIFAAASDVGISIPSVHVQRRSIIEPGAEDANLDYALRTVEKAASYGISVFSTGLHQRFTDAQQKALWFWTAPGAKDSDAPEVWDRAVASISKIGRLAHQFGQRVSLELYEDTLLGTAASAVRFVESVCMENVGINPDVGNLIRLHRPIEDWQEIYEATLPYANYWHLKNYTRDEAGDGTWFTSTPSKLEDGLINYRQVISDALGLGYDGVFVMEHYGGDSLGVCSSNAQYVRSIIDGYLATSRSGARLEKVNDK